MPGEQNTFQFHGALCRWTVDGEQCKSREDKKAEPMPCWAPALPLQNGMEARLDLKGGSSVKAASAVAATSLVQPVSPVGVDSSLRDVACV